MKHLLALMALFVAFAAGAQTWNPDADFDNVIGVNDLMALLSVFGGEWTAEYPQDPEFELAAYHAGYVDYWECVRTCTNNHAKIIGLHEYAMFEDSIIANALINSWTNYWLDDRVFSLVAMQVGDNSTGSAYTQSGQSSPMDFQYGKNCICTGLVPAVE